MCVKCAGVVSSPCNLCAFVYLLFAFKTMLIKVFTLMKSKAKYIFTSSMNYSLIPLFSLL